VLQITLELCWTQLGGHRPEPAFAIISYGKLGGKELGYASDLDIIFLYDDPHEQAPEIYARLAQRLNHWLTARTGAGVLFETDLRLRPTGERPHGELDRRLPQVPARVGVGLGAPGAHPRALLRRRRGRGRGFRGRAARHFATAPRRAEAPRGGAAMRRKLLEGHPNRSDSFDLKHDRGGMIDIEFVVQYLVLAHAHLYPELVANSGNIALLKLVGKTRFDSGGRGGERRLSLSRFRRYQHGLRLNGAKYARVPPAEVKDEIAATLALWRKVFGND